MYLVIHHFTSQNYLNCLLGHFGIVLPYVHHKYCDVAPLSKCVTYFLQHGALATENGPMYHIKKTVRYFSAQNCTQFYRHPVRGFLWVAVVQNCELLWHCQCSYSQGPSKYWYTVYIDNIIGFLKSGIPKTMGFNTKMVR